MNINDLEERGASPDLIKKWTEEATNGLLPLQKGAIDAGLLDGGNYLVVAPTSSGKTFLGEIVLTLNACRKKRGLYLVPFKALAEEKYANFLERYGGPDIGFMIAVSDRDHRERDSDIRLGNYDIAILTYEKLLALLTTNPALIDQCDCVVVDEIQMVMDQNRGATLELLLTAIRTRRHPPQIIGLSAVLGNLNGFDRWLHAKVITSRERPVELRQGVLKADGTFEYTEWNSGTSGTEHFSSGSLVEVVRELVGRNEQVIVVRNSVRGATNTAACLARELAGMRPATRTLDLLVDEPDTETRVELSRYLGRAVAFHHADCELAERRAVERGFRDGEIRALSSTTTLAAGVNLPCRTVILADNQKWEATEGVQGVHLVNWTRGEIRNILGRAGRLGLESDCGRGMLLAADQRDYYQVKSAYLDTSLEPMSSALEGRDFRTRVLDVVATGFGGTPNDISDFILSTYAAAKWDTEALRKQVRDYVSNGIEYCEKQGLLERKPSGEMVATRLGRICAAKGCSIDSFVTLSSYMQSANGMDLLDMAYAASLPKEVSGKYYRGVDWRNYDRIERLHGRLRERSADLSGRLKADATRLLDSFYEMNVIRVLSVFLAHDILLTDELTTGLKRAYILTHARLRDIAENLSWMLDIMAAIGEVVKGFESSQIQKWADSLLHLTPLKYRNLNEIPGIHRDLRIRLGQAGYLNEDDFVDLKPSDFKGIISPQKAEAIIKAISEKRVKDHLYWLRNHRQRLDAIGHSTRDLEAIYAATGLDLERGVVDLFGTGFASCTATRIAKQRDAEPDLLLSFPNGDVFAVQVTARENDKFVDSKKAGDVIPQSARFAPKGYVCIGRPDFQEFAREQVCYQAQQLNIKLIPVYVLGEMYVEVREGLLEPHEVCTFLHNTKGYIDIRRVQLLKENGA